MNAEYEKAFGQNIRTLRLQNQMTQDFLSTKLQLYNCDITRSALAKIEVGQRHIYPDELAALQKIFNVPFNQLFPDIDSFH